MTDEVLRDRDHVADPGGGAVTRLGRAGTSDAPAGDRTRLDQVQVAHSETSRFVAIVESTDDAIVSLTLDGVVTSWNPAAERMFGYSAAEVIGQPNARFIPVDRMSEEAMILRRIAAGERVEQLETVRLTSDGRLIPLAITCSPIRAADGEIVGVSKIGRDISARRAVEAAAERERRFAQSLIETMPGVFYLYDEGGRFLRWNRNFEIVSGYTPDEIAQMRPGDFFGADRALVHRRIAEVFDKGAATVDADFVARDGSATAYHFTGKRIVFDDKTCLVGVGVDVAERARAERALRKSEERYRTTLDNILESCQLLDSDWRYLYLNDAAATQNRRPNDELLGHRMPDAWPGIEDTEVFALLRRCMEERRSQHEEVEFTFPDGATGWFDVRVQAVPEGIFVMSIDITERRRAEVALRELNESLERKVAERTAELEEARERAEAADRIKSAFLATMSHELRTPLNSIIGFTGIILQGLAGPLNDEQTKQLGMVKGSARHLLELINDVLDISRIEAGQLEVRAKPFDLAASVERVVASVGPLAGKRSLALRLVMPETPTPMVSDRRRFEQVLLNLLNNAIKFTDRGEVTLTVEAATETPLDGGPDDAPERGQAVDALPRGVVRVRVADTGIGMKQEDMAMLFQPFRQLDAGIQRQHEGTGLGLAITSRLTRLLGGTIAVDSVWGQGSVFTVTLPLRLRPRPNQRRRGSP